MQALYVEHIYQKRKKKKKVSTGLIEGHVQYKGSFHLSEMTGQAFAVVTRNSFLIKTIQPAIKSWIACKKQIIFLEKLLKKGHFIVKMTGPAIVTKSIASMKKKNERKSTQYKVSL